MMLRRARARGFVIPALVVEVRPIHATVVLNQVHDDRLACPGEKPSVNERRYVSRAPTNLDAQRESCERYENANDGQHRRWAGLLPRGLVELYESAVADKEQRFSVQRYRLSRERALMGLQLGVEDAHECAPKNQR
jgi:hypothetical protein